ncbi:MAG: 30S ribosomal protein S12 methylthiotransferase RimO [Candidatus Aphodosoma sp.]
MRKNRVDIISLGCSKNLVDSERLMAEFAKYGYNVFHDSDDVSGEIVVANTCGFIGDAKEESINMILQLAEAKANRKIGKLFVMGCLSERYRKELEAEIPEVDRFYGKFDWSHMLSDLGRAKTPGCGQDRIITTPRHYAYVKIAEGCDRNCSYCAIPQATGRYKSRPTEEIVEEVTLLAKQGVREIQLIAQDITYYGLDLYHENRLAQLITAITAVDGIEWLRLHYAYPTNFPYEILPLIRENPKVCQYLDVALQHISDHMLGLMHRRISRQETYDFVRRLREEVPGIHIRTTLLTGHPGETEDDFEQLVSFVEEMRFERLGTFVYSDEDGTYSNLNYTDDVPDNVKHDRQDRIMALQEKIAAETNACKVGQNLKVIIDRTEGGYYVGRTEFDSPEVDGEVYIQSAHPLKTGEFYIVKITKADTYDLFAEL